MRKILLATTALVAFAGAAEAAQSPIEVTLGGSVDFRAALFDQSEAITTTTDRRSGDFQTEYNLVVAADGKAANGIQYGALIDLNNEGQTESALSMEQAYIWLSGAFGKVLMGDEHGASDLFVYAPTVGEGQIDGSYTRFIETTGSTHFQPNYFDMTENSTKITYYTPKVGNANHKVQLGVSYAPNDGNGADAALLDGDVIASKNIVKAAAQYTGTFSPVTVVVSPMLVMAEGEQTVLPVRDFTAWGIGAQATYAGFTLGTAYVDAGKAGTVTGDDRDQDAWNIGLKYEFDKVAVAANYVTGEGYQVLGATQAYVEDFDAIGFGATYTWFPGLTTAADAVFFDQDAVGTSLDDDGHVLMLSQKMTF